MKGKRYSNDRHIGMEPLVIDWAKEEAKIAKIWHIYVYY